MRLQQLATDTIVANIERVRSLRPLPDRIGFEINKRLCIPSDWNISLLRVLDGLELAVDFVCINSYFASNSKALEALCLFCCKYSKYTLKRLLFCNNQFISMPRIPKVINRFLSFSIETIEFFKVEFDQVKLVPFLRGFVGRSVNYKFVRCSGFEQLNSVAANFNDSQIELIDCTWNDLEMFTMAMMIKIASSSLLVDFLLPPNAKCKELWVTNVDLSRFTPSIHLERLFVPYGYELCKEQVPNVDVNFY